MMEAAQSIALGLLAVLVLLAHRLLGKHERLIREMAKTLASLATISAVLANTEMTRALRVPLVYCPTHGGQEAIDGRCVKCR
jgi:hypothetical protein